MNYLIVPKKMNRMNSCSKLKCLVVLIITGSIFFCAPANSQTGFLEYKNLVWKHIESVHSEEHRMRIAQNDESAFYKPGTGPLENAVLYGYQDLVEKFSADQQIVVLEGTLSLLMAASLGRLDALQTLLDSGVEVDSQGAFGWTALLMAAQFGELDTMKYLMGHGANINHRTDSPITILHFAILDNQIGIVEFLISPESSYQMLDRDKELLAQYIK